LSKPNASSPTILLDATIAIIGLLLFGTVIYNFIQIRSTYTEIQLNKQHLCWTMETMFGPPDGTNKEEACDALREQVSSYWSR
jgi:hypothetical protein